MRISLLLVIGGGSWGLMLEIEGAIGVLTSSLLAESEEAAVLTLLDGQRSLRQRI